MNTFISGFKDSSIRKKIFFTLLIIILYRVGVNLPLLGVNREVLSSLIGDNDIFSVYNMLSGGMLQNFTLFSFGVSPYITMSIIIQLLGVINPTIKEISQDGEIGKKKIEKYTLIGGIALAFLQGIGIIIGYYSVVGTIPRALLVIIELSLGVGLLSLMGKAIDEYGLGNGISTIIFTGIASRIVTDGGKVFTRFNQDGFNIVGFLSIILLFITILYMIVYVQEGMRKIPVTYNQRVSGRKTYKGRNAFIPIKVNQGGVLPIIFTLTIIQFPMTIAYMFPNSVYATFVSKWISPYGNPGIYIYIALEILLIAFFTFFYSEIIFSPIETANNLRSNGGVIPGIKPGRQTVEKLMKVTSSLNKVSVIFLVLIAITPVILSGFVGLNLAMGGTSAIILVGVAIEMIQSIDNELLMRREYGFLR